MNVSEQVLLLLMEECAEVQHITSKVLRFGNDDFHPVTGVVNRDAMSAELIDFLAVLGLAQTLGLVELPEDPGDAIDRKLDKVRKAMGESIRRGLLEDDIGNGFLHEGADLA